MSSAATTPVPLITLVVGGWPLERLLTLTWHHEDSGDGKPDENADADGLL